MKVGVQKGLVGAALNKQTSNILMNFELTFRENDS